MAYTAPTAAEVKARFPEFAAVADATVTAIIEEAGSYVDQTWIEADYKLAQMLWTAHTLIIEGNGSGVQAQLSQLGAFSRIKSGDLEVQQGTRSGAGEGGAGADSYERTTYGQRFSELRLRSFPPVLLI